MSSLSDSHFYKSCDDVGIYNKTRCSLPDSVGERIMYEVQKRRKTSEDEQIEFMIDVGCGKGRHMKLFAPHFKKIVAFDVTELQIQEALELNPFDNVTYMVGNVEAMPIEESVVDFAAFIFSAQFMDIKIVERELLRVLKPGGAAILYGDLVDEIELLDSNGKVVEFPDLSKSPVDLWNDLCINPIGKLPIETNLTDRRFLDRFEYFFEAIEILQKEKVQFQYRECQTLDDLISYHYPGIPSCKKFADSQAENPFDVFAKELKKLWNISHLGNQQVDLKITRGSFMVVLEQKAAQ